MEILKVKLQIALGLIICVLIYNHMSNPPQQAAPEITIDMVEQQAAQSKMDPRAQAAANGLVATGDMAEFQKQLGEQGLVGN